MNSALLGIDIGTSSCKAILIDMEGRVLSDGLADYPLSQPHPGWTEQDPALWFAGAQRAVALALAKAPKISVAAIGLSGQMHGLTPLSADGEVLRPAILWNDQRNAAECDEITEAAGGIASLLETTNNRMLIGYTGGKILWMRRHEPAVFARMSHVLNPKDYLRFALTGEIATEVSDASGTGFFDVRRRVWATPLIEKLGFDPSLMPPCFESHEITGHVSVAGAALFGLPKGTPVVGGGGDSVIQTIGSGVIAPGELQTTIGTAGILAAALDTAVPNPDGRVQVFCNVGPGKWHAMGVSLNAGGAMSWLRNILTDLTGATLSFDDMVRAAEDVPPGARGLVFLPYLNGERCPHPDPDARGAFIGLTARHGAADIVRAVMEGIVHAFGDMHMLMRPMGIPGRLIKASGGGARSVLWRQMQADLFGCDVVTTEGATGGAAYGAALVAGVGLGIWPDVTAAAAALRELTRETPDADRGAVYRRGQEIYRRLYPVLRDTFVALDHPDFVA
jgi:xylulokinase